MKKLIALLLALTLIIGLTACGSGKKESTNADGKTVLKIWTWDVNYAFFNAIKEDFEAEHPDIVLDIEEMGTTQIYNKLTTGLQTGSGLPDIVTLEGEQMAKFGIKFPDKMLDLSDIVDPAQFMPVKMSEVTIQDKIIGVPWDSAPAALFYRIDFFEEAGIKAEDIKTWDDYIEAGKVINEKLGIKMMPLSVARNDILFRMLLNQAGGFYFDEAGNSTVNSPEAIDAMTMVKKIYDADITLDFGTWDEYIISMKEGNVATVAEAVWIIGSFKEEIPDSKGKWGVMPFPMLNDTSTGTATNGGSVACIPAASENQDAAKIFLQYALMREDVQMKAFQDFGLFPSYLPVFASPDFKAEDEFFNNENIYDMFGELGERIPQFNYTQNFEEAVEMSKNNNSRVLLSGADPKEALDELQEEYVTKFGK